MISGIGIRHRRHQRRQKTPPGPHGAGRLPWVLALVTSLTLIVTAGGQPWRQALRFDREGLGAWEAWRLGSAHVVHLGWSHAILNLIAMVVIAVLFRPLFSAGGWILIATASALAVDAGLWWGSPGTDWYVGMSGVLHGVMAGASVSLIARRDKAGIAILALMILKIAWEQLAGPLPASAEAAGGLVVVDAHLYGAIGGGLAAAAMARAGGSRQV